MNGLSPFSYLLNKVAKLANRIQGDSYPKTEDYLMASVMGAISASEIEPAEIGQLDHEMSKLGMFTKGRLVEKIYEITSSIPMNDPDVRTTNG